MADLSGFLGGFTGSTIGSASVKMYVDNKAYQTELAKSQTQLKSSTSSMGSGLSKLSGLGTVAFSALAAGAGAFALASVNAAREAEAAQTELANSVENSASVSESAIPVFNEQAEAIRQLTGADDEAITSSQAFLVQMGLTQDQITSLTPLIVDLATKMDVDMQTAAKAVGKSVNGTTGGLSRMGVVVDANAAKTDAYAATLDALGVAEGFAAQKAEDEPWRKLASTFEEIQEQVGAALIPTLNTLADALNVLLNNLPRVTVYVVAFAAAWVAMNHVIVAVKFLEIASQVATLGAAFGPLILTVVAVTRALQLANAEFDHFRDGNYEAVVNDVRKGFELLGISIPGAEETSDLEGFRAAFAGLKSEIESGTVTTEEATKRLEEMSDEFHVGLPDGAAAAVKSMEEVRGAGITLPDVFKNIEQGVKGVGRQVRDTSRSMRQAARDEFVAYRDSLVETFDVVGESVIGFKAKFQGTVRSFTLGLERMRTRLTTQVEDLKAFNDLHIGKGVEDFLLKQGPDAIHNFVGANKEARGEILGVINDIIDKTHAQGGELDTAARKVENFKGKFKDLDGMQANLGVLVRYDIDPAGLDPGKLPGLVT